MFENQPKELIYEFFLVKSSRCAAAASVVGDELENMDSLIDFT